MREIKIPGMGSVFHPGSEEEANEHEELLRARAEFVAEYCKKKGWPLPGEPGFDQISFEQIMEVRSQEGWKNPLKKDDPPSTSVVLGSDASVIVPKGKN